MVLKEMKKLNRGLRGDIRVSGSSKLLLEGI